MDQSIKQSINQTINEPITQVGSPEDQFDKAAAMLIKGALVDQQELSMLWCEEQVIGAVPAEKAANNKNVSEKLKARYQQGRDTAMSFFDVSVKMTGDSISRWCKRQSDASCIDDPSFTGDAHLWQQLAGDRGAEIMDILVLDILPDEQRVGP